MNQFKAGYIAIIGRPNVGKSTLLNYILGEKLAITSRKPQTTRQSLLGIHTKDDVQFIFIDTPGLHLDAGKKINYYMNKSAQQATDFVDLIVHISDGTRWTDDDDYVIKLLAEFKKPVVHVINKIDLLSETKEAIPLIDSVNKKFDYQEVIPVSALKNTNIDYLLDILKKYLPFQEAIYPKDQITNASMRFIASEVVREKLFKVLHQELPYSLAVVTDEYKEGNDRIEIYVTILLERSSQKPIVIGKGGKILKMIGIQARKELEEITDKKVSLKTWVKIKENWSDNDSTLHQLGLSGEINKK